MQLDVIEHAMVLLEREEGFREVPYYCSQGYPTIGIGQRIGPQSEPLDKYGFTCPLPVAKAWLRDTVQDVHRRLSEYPFYAVCNPVRQAVLIAMAYQLGLSGLLKFKKMRAAIEQSNWSEAKKEGLDSRWAQQTPQRAQRQMYILSLGEMPNELMKDKVNQ